PRQYPAGTPAPVANPLSLPHHTGQPPPAATDRTWLSQVAHPHRQSAGSPAAATPPAPGLAARPLPGSGNCAAATPRRGLLSGSGAASPAPCVAFFGQDCSVGHAGRSPPATSSR